MTAPTPQEHYTTHFKYECTIHWTYLTLQWYTLACPGPFSSTSYSNSNPKTNGYCKDYNHYQEITEETT